MSNPTLSNTTSGDASPASGIDPGGIAPGEQVNTRAKPNPQADQSRSFQPDQGGEAAAGEDRVDTDGDGRARDPNDTRPTDKGGREPPVQR